jgi:putative DNA primase/helicase
MTDEIIPWEAPPIEAYDNVVQFPGTKSAEISEDTVALAFTERFGETMRFDHSRGAWFQWNESHWQVQDTPVAFHSIRMIARNISGGAKSVCKAAFVRGAENLAKGEPVHAVTAEIWDSDPWLLGTPAGTLNLRTGKMVKPSPAHNITKMTGCIPENKPPTLWLKFLDDATRGDAAMMTYLQRVAGYCLTGLTTEHALFFIYGSGGNGKSVFLNVLVHILKDYAVTSAMDTFEKSKGTRHPTDLAMLKGARLVTASETEEGQAWADARIKAMTGGDPITARFMAKDFFTYQPQFKLLFAGNHQPALSGVDAAMRRRFNMLPFIHRPERPDESLEEKLRAEAPRILAWALHGCLDWQKHGLGRPTSVIDATNDYFEAQDMFGQWVEEFCETGPELWDQPTPLFENWVKFAKAQGELPGGMRVFADRLKKAGYRDDRDGKMRKYRGISLKRQDLGYGHN